MFTETNIRHIFGSVWLGVHIVTSGGGRIKKKKKKEGFLDWFVYKKITLNVSSIIWFSLHVTDICDTAFISSGGNDLRRRFKDDNKNLLKASILFILWYFYVIIESSLAQLIILKRKSLGENAMFRPMLGFSFLWKVRLCWAIVRGPKKSQSWRNMTHCAATWLEVLSLNLGVESVNGLCDIWLGRFPELF